MTPEAKLSKYLRSECMQRGWQCIKMEATNYRGLPDRMIIIPGDPAVIVMVEIKVKRKYDRHENEQVLMIDALCSLGLHACMVEGKTGIDELIEELDSKYAIN